MSVNKVILLGRIGREIELKYVPSGAAVASFSVATSEKFKGKDGQPTERTEWHEVKAWRQLAEICAKIGSKGREVYIEGRIETEKWDDRDGNKRERKIIVADVVRFVGGGSSPSERADRGSQGNSRSESTGGGGDVYPPFNDDSDIPF